MKLIARRGVLVLAVLAGAGLALFAVAIYRAVGIEVADRAGAAQRFAAVRAELPPGPAMLTLDETGAVVRREMPRRQPASLRRLRVLAYRADSERVVSVDVPFWFLRMKGPGIRFALRDTGLDLDRLGIAPGDLQRYGPAVVIDHARSNGDRLLVWTE